MDFAKRLLAALVAALVLTGWASAVLAQVETRPDTLPDWRKKPTAADLMSVWPAPVNHRYVDGEATIHCKVSPQGGLYDCLVVSQRPAGAGFGSAALALTPQFAMKPATKGGKPVAYDGVTIPINFTGSRWMSSSVETTPVLSTVGWVSAPSYADVAAAFPKRARATSTGGRAVVACSIAKTGRLVNCSTLSEAPGGQGFGAAARKLATGFEAPIKLSGGRSTSGMLVQVPITFAPEMMQAGDPVIGKPQWVALPTVEQIGQVMPPQGVGVVRVTLNCRVGAGGKVADCKAEKESPPGQGFATAALAMSAFFQMSLWTPEGLPTVGGRISIPIRYDLGPGISPPAKP